LVTSCCCIFWGWWTPCSGLVSGWFRHQAHCPPGHLLRWRGCFFGQQLLNSQALVGGWGFQQQLAQSLSSVVTWYQQLCQLGSACLLLFEVLFAGAFLSSCSCRVTELLAQERGPEVQGFASCCSLCTSNGVQADAAVRYFAIRAEFGVCKCLVCVELHMWRGEGHQYNGPFANDAV